MKTLLARRGVRNIYKYYIPYRLVSDQRDRRAAAKAEVGKRN
jgi:hypothetical protein